MSKIPQGEWNAIAARYQGGESISKIARSYGCTPPAIHYILKRNRQRPGEIAAQGAPIRSAEAAPSGLVRSNLAASASAVVQYAEKFDTGSAGSTALRAGAPEARPAAHLHAEKPDNGGPRLGLFRASGSEAPTSLPLGVRLSGDTATVQSAPAFSRRDGTGRLAVHHTSSSPVPMLGLDNELHLRAEAAIAMFRSSFDAALAEGSPGVRAQLRQAASDLMRVAARTTIVLDRLNATAERSARAHNYPRSAHAGDDLDKFGS